MDKFFLMLLLTYVHIPERSKGLDSRSNAICFVGSNPTMYTLDIAQLVEQGTVVPWVTGSSPVVEKGLVV